MRPLLQILLLVTALAVVHAGDDKSNFTQYGSASFYSASEGGRKTASGEHYDPAQLTGAHRNLPLGTSVTVTNLRNGKSVTVRINDRGPYRKHRIIDLSTEAAKELDMIRDGTVKVKLAVVQLPSGNRN